MIIFLGKDYDLYSALVGRSRGDRDIVVSCQYPFLIPESLIASHPCVNIHYGALPEFRGMSPVYWQMMQAETVGVSLHYVDRHFDRGDVIDIERFDPAGLTAEAVYQRCRMAGVTLLERWYARIVDGTAPRLPQDDAKARYFRRDEVDFNQRQVLELQDADLDRRVRALHFAGKQYPEVSINGVRYELHRTPPQT